METQLATLDNPAHLVAADRNPAAAYVAGLASPRSRRAMLTALDTVARTLTSGEHDARSLDWTALRYQHVAALRSALVERYAPATVNLALCAVRGVAREAWRMGLLDGDAYQRIADVDGVKGSTLPAGRSIEAGELRSMFRGCSLDSTPAGRRDAALLAVLYAAGLRRFEVAALSLGDFNAETGALTVRAGKGRKARVAYAPRGGREALSAWLAVRGATPGALFVPLTRGGNLIQREEGIEARALTPAALWAIVQKRATAGGVAHLSPHDFRRTFVGDLLDAGADLATVAQLAGHADVSTTARYDRRGEAAKKRAAELLHVPFEVAR